MNKLKNRHGSVNSLYVLGFTAVVLIIILTIILFKMGQPTSPVRSTTSGSSTGSQTQPSQKDNAPAEGLFFYCAAGVRPPVERIAAQYEKEYGVPIRIQYGGSQTLLSQLEVANTGDLYLAADESYMTLAHSKDLVQERLPIGFQKPVIAVRKGNPKNIHGIKDLLRSDVKCALGNPDQAAIGRVTRKLLLQTGQWDKLKKHVTQSGVFFPTVPEVANAVKLGSVDAGIVWDATLATYPELEAVAVPELDRGKSKIIVGILSSASNPTRALHFARYLTAEDKGLAVFRQMGFKTVVGDKWEDVPEIVFYVGSVNRRSIDSIIKEFEQREGVRINTVYNGCGILTAQMRTIREQRQGLGFPDAYMACDVYYLNTVKDWFQEAVEVSDTEIVIAVPKGNPKGIKSLKDLAKPGLRVSVGQPDQCTIGVLTRELLKKEGLYDAIMKNVVTQTASSAMLVPTVVTHSVDATLAYLTDTLAEKDKVDVIHIPSEAAKAVQPFAIAKSSQHKWLCRRLFEAIAASKDKFDAAGFHFRLKGPRPTKYIIEKAGQ